DGKVNEQEGSFIRIRCTEQCVILVLSFAVVEQMKVRLCTESYKTYLMHMPELSKYYTNCTLLEWEWTKLEVHQIKENLFYFYKVVILFDKKKARNLKYEIQYYCGYCHFMMLILFHYDFFHIISFTSLGFI